MTDRGPKVNIWKIFRTFRIVSIKVRNTETKRKFFGGVSRNKCQTDLVSVCFGSNQNIFFSFQGHPSGGTHSPCREGDGGSIFWKRRDIGLPSYSNNLSTPVSLHASDFADMMYSKDIRKNHANLILCLTCQINIFSYFSEAAPSSLSIKVKAKITNST